MSIYADLLMDSAPQFLFNSGSLYDLMTGSFHVCDDGKYRLSGGFGGFITGAHGYGNTYKTTMMQSFVAGAMRIYPEAYEVLVDTEGRKDKTRVAYFNDTILNNPDRDIDITPRISLKGGSEFCINGTWEYVKKLVEIRKKNKKALMVETPFTDIRTGQRALAWEPLIVFIDSLTELESTEEDEMINSAATGIEDGKNKTIWLVDGNKKTVLVRHLRKVAEEYGIIVICTAHTGGNIAMDPRSPPTKQLQHMKQADAMKGVGSRFEFLTQTLVQTRSCAVLTDSAKEPLYPDGPTPDNDLNEVILSVQRNKTNSSGQSVPFVVSQSQGMLNTATNLHYIRSVADYQGLNGGPSKPKHACVWLPETNFSRKDFRALAASNYELDRAIELTAQFAFIKNNWNLRTLNPGLQQAFQLTPEQIFDKLNSKKANLRQLLQTTGYWTIEGQGSGREYMSIFDFLLMTAD